MRLTATWMKASSKIENRSQMTQRAQRDRFMLALLTGGTGYVNLVELLHFVAAFLNTMQLVLYKRTVSPWRLCTTRDFLNSDNAIFTSHWSPFLIITSLFDVCRMPT